MRLQSVLASKNALSNHLWAEIYGHFFWIIIEIGKYDFCYFYMQTTLTEHSFSESMSVCKQNSNFGS
jgi:hypothetical protein